MNKVLVLVALMVLVVFTPFAIIWSLNTLFGLTLGYTLKNWVAVEVIWFVFSGIRKFLDK